MDAASSDKSGIRIEPIAAVHIDSFHHALDVVAREKKYLSMLEATPLPQMREFVMDMIAKGNPQFVATAENQVLGWCDISRHFSRPTPIAENSEWESFPPIGARASDEGSSRPH